MNCTHDVSIAIDVLQEVLQAPTEALAATQNGLGELVVKLLKLSVDVFEDQSDDSTNGNDKRSESQCSEMKAKGAVDGP